MFRILQFLCRHPGPIVLVSVPWLLLLLNPNWPFGNANHCDPWFYYGYFCSYPGLYLQHPSYDGERLPGILPGYLLHLLFQPVVAQVLLHVIFFTIAIFSLYYTLKQIRDHRTAMLTTLLLACHAFFLGAIGWDYGDGFCIAYYLLTIAFLTRAWTAARPGPWIACAGATSAFLVYTYPLWVVFLPFLLVYYTVQARQQGRSTFLSAGVRFTLFYVLGFALVTLAFASLSYVTVGTFYFYKWSIETMRNLDKAPEWHNTDLGWLTHGTWIVFPVMTFLASIAYLLRKRAQDPQSKDRPVWLFLGNFICCFLALSYLTFVKGRRLLEFDYYTSSLIGPMFLAWGVTFLRPPLRTTWRILVPTVSAAFLICVFPLWWRGYYPDLLLQLEVVRKHPSLLDHYLLYAGILGLTGVFLRIVLPQSIGAWIICIASLCVAGFGLVPGFPKAPWVKTYRGPSLYARVTRAREIVQMHMDPKIPTFFWFNLAEKGTLDYLAINRSLREHGKADFNFPSLGPGVVLPPESVVLILSENKDIPPAAVGTLGQRGLSGKVLYQMRMAEDNVSYWMTFLRVSTADTGVSAGGQQLSGKF